MAAGTDTQLKLDTTAGDAVILIDRVRLPQATLALLDPHAPELQARAVSVGGRGAAWFVRTGAGPAVLRHYRRGGLAARVSRERYLWLGAERSRGFHEFRLLCALRDRDLPVPAPLVAAYWRAGLTYRAALLIERIAGARSLGDLLDAGETPPWASIGETIARFHRVGAFHADLNVDNVLMDAQDKVWLIDFDRGALRKPARRWQRANLARLQRSLRKRVGAAAGRAPISDGWRDLLSAYDTSMKSISMEQQA
jgi:3-deoxy-D-manno-octulosonic acid kinase